jgi:hypothetical protein
MTIPAWLRDLKDGPVELTLKMVGDLITATEHPYVRDVDIHATGLIGNQAAIAAQALKIIATRRVSGVFQIMRETGCVIGRDDPRPKDSYAPHVWSWCRLEGARLALQELGRDAVVTATVEMHPKRRALTWAETEMGHGSTKGRPGGELGPGYPGKRRGPPADPRERVDHPAWTEDYELPPLHPARR